MNRKFATFFLSLLTVVWAAPGVTAYGQAQERVSNARELDPDEPRAKRAIGLATLLTGTDLAEAQKYAKTHAAKDVAAALQKQVKDLHATVASKFVVDRVVEGPEDEVLVLLNSASGGRGGRMGLRVTVERSAPHRIREIAAMQGRRQQGGGE